MNNAPRIAASFEGFSARFLLAALSVLVLGLAQSAGVRAALPELPRTYVDTTYAPPSGNTIIVNAGGSLQTAINNAVPGDTIVLQAGATFTGPFTLPNKPGSGWIYIRSSNYASLPAPGSRVSPADAGNMPKIVVAAGVGGAIRTSTGAHNYRFVGIEVRPVANAFVYNLVEIGGGETSAANLPRDIVFDRCYVHGDPAAGSRRGIAMDGIGIAIVDSYLSDFKEWGADTQAAWAYNTPGPLKLVNNFLEAAGENFMAGGADPRIPNAVPSDIEIRGNHFFKPLSWMGSSWTVKNSFELKNAQRVLVEGNVFENVWLAGQQGFAIVLTPRNQDGSCGWCVTQDLTFRRNKLVNAGAGINISGEDDNYTSLRTRRVLVEDNLLLATRLNGSDPRLFQMIHGPAELTIRHNTALILSTGGLAGMSENYPVAADFAFVDNLVSNGSYGFTGTGTGAGYPTLNTFYSTYTFTRNALIGNGIASAYPPTNYFPTSTGAVGFVNYSGGDYRLASTSPYRGVASDGKDLGADINAMTAATACAVGGQCSGTTPPPPPPPPPPTGDTTPPVISAVAATGIGPTQATITWTTNELADTQVEYGWLSTYGNKTVVNTTMTGSHSQTVTGLLYNTLYHFRVISKDASGNVATSADYLFTTPPPGSDTTPPAITGVSSPMVTSGGATIVWTTNEASDSQVEYGLTTAYGSSTALDATRVTSHSQALGGLQASRTYHYRVKSRDAAGNLATSANFTFTTLGVIADTTPPVISAVAATGIGPTQATITWTTNEPADTQVEYGWLYTYGSKTVVNTTMTGSHSQTLTGLLWNTLYHFRVISKDASGNVATSADYMFTTPPPSAGDTTAPGVPSGLGFSDSGRTWATPSWNASTDNVGVAGYRMDVSTSSGFTSFVSGYQNRNVGNVTSFRVSGLQRRTTYYVRVRAFDAAGNTSANSVTVSVRTN